MEKRKSVTGGSNAPGLKSDPAVDSVPSPKKLASEDTLFIPAKPSDSRCPCPALNTLANHGYINRDGKNIGFGELMHAVAHTYNVSYPLAFLLTFTGFFTSMKYTHIIGDTVPRPQTPSIFSRFFAYLRPRRFYWAIDLETLSKRGPYYIAHDAALAHPDGISSRSPNPKLVDELSRYALDRHDPSSGKPVGFTLEDLAHIQAERRAVLSTPLNGFHSTIALGEGGLAWCVMRVHSPSRPQNFWRKFLGKSEDVRRDELEDVIPLDRFKQWIGEERLPDGWWGNPPVRPSHTIGLLEARGRANDVQKLMQRKA